jgi:uncharacterized protein
MASGANLDDLGDWRPGLKAAERHGVRHPLIEAGIAKADIRALAAEEGLSDLAELPASPCLSSRIETGIPVTVERLGVVLEVERLLQRALPGATLRCRIRPEGLAVEVDAARLPELDTSALGPEIAAMARAAGLPHAVAFRPYRRGSAFIHAG